MFKGEHITFMVHVYTLRHALKLNFNHPKMLDLTITRYKKNHINTSQMISHYNNTK